MMTRSELHEEIRRLRELSTTHWAANGTVRGELADLLRKLNRNLPGGILYLFPETIVWIEEHSEPGVVIDALLYYGIVEHRDQRAANGGADQ